MPDTRYPLNDCLHCRGEAEARSYTGGIGVVICKECGIQTPFLPFDEAIARWNSDARWRKKGVRNNA